MAKSSGRPTRTDGRRLADAAGGVFAGRGWQGTTLTGAVRGMKAAAASTVPRGCRHSVWGIILHAAYWKYAVLVTMGAAEPNSFERSPSNWPRVPDRPDERAWRRDLAYLKSLHERFAAFVTNLSDSELDEIPPRGKSWTRRKLIDGIIAHDAYHTGQVQLMKAIVKRGA